MTSRDKIKILMRKADELKELFNKSCVTEDTVKRALFSKFDVTDEEYKALMKHVAQQDKSVRFYMELLEFSKEKQQKFLDEWNKTPDIHKYPDLETFMDQEGMYVVSRIKIELMVLYNAYQWAENRSYYNYTKEFSDALISSAEQEDTNDIPVETLRYLPHDAFFIDGAVLDAFNETSNGTYNGQFMGINVFKFEEDNEEKLKLTPMYYGSGATGDVITVNVDIPISSKMTYKELLEQFKEKTEQEKNVFVDLYGPDFANEEYLSDLKDECDICEKCLQTLPLLLYLTVEKPDLKKSGETQKEEPNKPQRKQQKTGLQDNVQKYTVGHEYTIKYQKFVKSVEQHNTTEHSANEFIRRMPPHERSGHWHHHWHGSETNPEKYGPRRLVLHWQDPTFVHMEYKDYIDPTVWEVDQDNDNEFVQEQEYDDYEK